MSRSFGPKDPTAGPKSPLAMVSLQGRGVAESGSADVGELDAPASGTFDITLSGALASRLGGCMLTREASTLSGPIDPSLRVRVFAAEPCASVMALASRGAVPEFS